MHLLMWPKRFTDVMLGEPMVSFKKVASFFIILSSSCVKRDVSTRGGEEGAGGGA